MIGGDAIPMPSGRPTGRDAKPGQLCGPQRPGEWPAGGHPQCRRCTAACTLEGHPYGCPRTPTDWGFFGQGLNLCYCGQSTVIWPRKFWTCCEDTPPVRVPGGCRWCGSELCRVNDPEQLPDNDYYSYDVPERFPDLKPAASWVHAGCIDEYLISKGREDIVASRRAKRLDPVGGMGGFGV